MKHKTRENIIIYGSLILAIILVCYVAKTYYDNRDNSEEVFRELEEVFNKNIEDNNETEAIIELEPARIKGVDKISVINTYIDDILNRRIKDDVLTYDIISTWGNIEVDSISYVRRIANDYYSYNVFFKISNREGSIVGTMEKEKSTDEYSVIKLIFNFVIDEKGIIVKNVME